MKKGKLFYGWWIVVSCFFIMIAIGGIANGIPIFFKPISEALHMGMGDISGTVSVIAIVGMAGSIIAGRLIKCVNIRVLMTVSALLVTGGYTFYSRCTSVIGFYAVSAVIGMGLGGIFIVPLSVLITNWFNKKLGTVMAVAMTGSGVGGMIFAPLNNWMIESFGWSNGFLYGGIMTTIIILPITLFLVVLDPKEKGLEPYGGAKNEEIEETMQKGLTFKEAARTGMFWAFIVALVATEIVLQGFSMHYFAYFVTAGFDASFVSKMFGISMGLLLITKPLYGWINDRFGAMFGMFYVYIFNILLALVLLISNTPAMVIVFMVILSLGGPIMTVSFPLWTVGIVGKKDYAMIYGIVSAFVVVGDAVGAVLPGIIYDSTGSYSTAWVAFAGMTFISMLLVAFALNRGKNILAKQEAKLAETL